MLNLNELGYRECRDVWIKPVEIHDTVRSGDKVVKVDAFLLFCFRPPSTLGFYCQDGSLRGRSVGADRADAVQRFEQDLLKVKHWFYILPQRRQFQEAVRTWIKDGQDLTLVFDDLKDIRP